jgi:hypothetical protein
MIFRHRRVLGFATALLLLASSAWASPGGKTQVELPGNESFFQLMKEKLADAVSAERDHPFSIDAAKIKTALNDVDETYLKSKVNLMLPEGTSKDPEVAKGRETTFNTFLKDVAKAFKGKTTTAGELIDDPAFKAALGKALGRDPEAPASMTDPKSVGLNRLTFGALVALGSGGGVDVPLDDASHFILLSNRSTNRKGGADLTAFMDTPTHKTLPTAYGRFANELAAMPHSDDANFTKSLLEVLAKSETKTISKLSDVGQTVMTDFLGVLGAELYRGITSGGKQHWETDHVEATFLADFVRASGMVLEPKPGTGEDADLPLAPSDATLKTDGTFKDFLGHGGFMHPRPQRRLLSTLITDFMKADEDGKAAIDRLETAMGLEKPSGDVYQDLATYTMSDAASTTKKGQTEFVSASNDFLTLVRQKGADALAQNGGSLAKYFASRGVSPPSVTPGVNGALGNDLLKARVNAATSDDEADDR